jgi:hypothetical protein
MKAIHVNKYLMPVFAVLTLLGSVWVAKAAGVWQTSGRGQVLLDDSGQPDPMGIKGWMTLSSVSETYGVPLDELYNLIGASPDVSPDTALKDLEKLTPGMEVWALREAVGVYLAGDREGDVIEDAPPPTPTPTPEPSPDADHLPRGAGEARGAGHGEGFSLPQDGSRLPGSQIKGRMTLQEVIDACQVPLAYLTAELGLAGDVDTGVWMRDLANHYGIEVSTVREVVERYQAEH